MKEIDIAQAFAVPLADVKFVPREYVRHDSDSLPCDGDVVGTPYARKNGDVVYYVTELAYEGFGSEHWAWERREVRPYADASSHKCGCGCGQTRVVCFRCGSVSPSGRFASKGSGKMREMCHECADEADAREPEYSTRK